MVLLSMALMGVILGDWTEHEWGRGERTCEEIDIMGEIMLIPAVKFRYLGHNNNRFHIVFNEASKGSEWLF